MDVIPIVGKEIATRFHKCANAGGDAIGGDKSAAAIAAVTADLASLLVRLWLLGSSKADEAGNVGDTPEHIEELVESVLKYLYACSMPSLATVLVQSQGYALKATIRSRRRAEEVKMEAIGLRLMQAIVAKSASTTTADEVLGDITLYILHRYGQLHSSDGADVGLPTHKETATVLCSVLPRPQALSFVKQDAMEKQRQLEELRRIVWGIRIFNKNEGKMAGMGLTELHELVEKPLVKMEESLGRELERMETKAHRSLALLQSPSCPLSEEEQRVLKEEYHHLLQLTANLLVVRCLHRALSNRIHAVIIPNHNSSLNKLRDIFSGNTTTTATAAHSKTIQSTLSDASDELSATNGERERARPEAVKKRDAYPVFMQLADTYSLAVKTVEELEDADGLFQLTLQSEGSYTSTIPDKAADDAVAAGVVNEPSVVELDAASMEAEVARLVAKAEATAAAAAAASDEEGGGEGERNLVTPSSVGLRLYYTPELPLSLMDVVVAECYPASYCALRGFCPVTYVETSLLVPGRVTGRASDSRCPGFIVMEGGSGREWTLSKPLYFAFVDEHALRKFVADPLHYFTGCTSRCDRSAPAIALLMGLVDRLPGELYIAGSRTVERTTSSAGAAMSIGVAATSLTSNVTNINTTEVGTQTGQIDAHLDHNYRWNEWDLRRQALKLANLMDMRTHSTQTAASHFRRDGTTQAEPPKEEGTQTMQDAATQPPRVVQYLKGLRGVQSSEVEHVKRTILY